ncbi:hypothetical protein H6G96_31760 [Nostoc sp. FACHB-892]|uniref:hypothetical protein n=1 Tax=Nostoc sp. FACHB-892 TaxID=2692843 RepID=UPI001682D586|nr:hypothetical protein [Nostoc sp. FACHB-892]MBD2730773.1 hypothetical protein [Nostoc sp. FACHB-892]
MPTAYGGKLRAPQSREKIKQLLLLNLPVVWRQHSSRSQLKQHNSSEETLYMGYDER